MEGRCRRRGCGLSEVTDKLVWEVRVLRPSCGLCPHFRKAFRAGKGWKPGVGVAGFGVCFGMSMRSVMTLGLDLGWLTHIEVKSLVHQELAAFHPLTGSVRQLESTEGNELPKSHN